MLIRIFFLLATAMVLAGCTANPVTGKGDRAQATAECLNESVEKFLPDGHAYTTLSVTDIAKYPQLRKYVISYYSQYPDIDHDYEATPVALKFLLVPWEWGWRKDVMSDLHSLHGGGRDEIDQRRKNIEDVLSYTLRDPSLDWQSGLVIHAYADAYAHTSGVFSSRDEEAYGYLIGHAIPTLFGTSPDEIKANDNNESKFFGYIDSLYASLKQDDSSDPEFAEFKEEVSELECGDVCPDFHELFLKEDDKEKINFGHFVNCMNRSALKLTESEVQSVMDMIESGGEK